MRSGAKLKDIFKLQKTTIDFVFGLVQISQGAKWTKTEQLVSMYVKLIEFANDRFTWVVLILLDT